MVRDDLNFLKDKKCQNRGCDHIRQKSTFSFSPKSDGNRLRFRPDFIQRRQHFSNHF